MNVTRELAYWPLLRLLSSDLLCKVDQFYLFASGQSALLFTTTGCVYGFGDNTKLQLPVGWRLLYNTDQPVAIHELDGCALVSVLEEDDFTLALNRDGDLLGWGPNVTGMLGVGHREPITTPTLVMVNIAKVESNTKCVLALDRTGTVFFWNVHSIGHLPRRLSQIANFKVSHIGCATTVCLALTDDARLFVWNDNLLVNEIVVDEIVLAKRLNVKSIVVLPKRNIAFYLDSTGCVYRSSCLGRFELRGEAKLDPIDSMMHWQDQVYLLSVTGACYTFDSNMTDRLVQTCCTSVSDVHHFYSDQLGTPMLTRLLVSPSTIKTLNSLNDLTTSDLTLLIQPSINFEDEPLKQAKPLYVHRSTLAERSKHFSSWLEKHSDEREINLTEFRFPACYSYLRYLYTSELDYKPTWLFELFYIANLFKEDKLKSKLEIIIDGLSFEALVRLYHIYSGDDGMFTNCNYLWIRDELETRIWPHITAHNCSRVYEMIYDCKGSSLMDRVANFAHVNMRMVSKSYNYRRMSKEARVELTRQARKVPTHKCTIC